jgi:hypothetical protein
MPSISSEVRGIDGNGSVCGHSAMNTLIDDGSILWGLNRHGCLFDFGTVFFLFD